MLFGRKVLIPTALAASMLVPATAQAGDPTGVWMNDTGRGAIEIKQCDGGLCGHVVWVKDTSDNYGCGRQIIGNAAKASANTWENGWIYSPERKKKYNLELTALDENRLRVKGYAGTKLFSKTMIWTRAPADLVRCGDEQIAAKPTLQPVTKAAAEPPVRVPAPVPAARPSKEIATPPPAPEAHREEIAAVETEEEVSESPLRERLGEFLTKRDDGTCNLDLPWVKLDFPCEKKR